MRCEERTGIARSLAELAALPEVTIARSRRRSESLQLAAMTAEMLQSSTLCLDRVYCWPLFSIDG
jgi:hypothetical protein